MVVNIAIQSRAYIKKIKRGRKFKKIALLTVRFGINGVVKESCLDVKNTIKAQHNIDGKLRKQRKIFIMIMLWPA